jgi:hypothetical protein
VSSMPRKLIAISILLGTVSVTPAQEPRQNKDGISITYVNPNVKPIRAITAIALESHMPIGIVLCQNQDILCGSEKSFDIQNRTPKEALATITASVGYDLTEEQGVLVLTAGDLEPWQREVLDHRYKMYRGGTQATMSILGVNLTGAIRMDVGNITTFASSTLYNPDNRRVTLGDEPNTSTEEVANKIVNLDGKGIWILRSTVDPPTGPADDEVRVYSYMDDSPAIQDLTCGP